MSYNRAMREWDLLHQVYRLNAALPSSVTIPPGDDMGAVRLDDDQVLVTVDQIIDGLHFRLSDTPVAKIGRKAITRNLSDVAAMAAQPVGAVVAAVLPRELGEARTLELFNAMRTTALAYGCPLFGGDISIWDKPLVLSVTVLAQPDGVTPLRRNGAKPGDVICVTGQLGGSFEAMPGANGSQYVHHLDFEPRLTVARKLATQPGLTIHSMIDLSDGLATDLGHICRASGVGAEISCDRLPVSEAARRASDRTGRPAWQHALTDGEDYELCFTVDPASADQLPADIDGVPITRIGIVTERHDDGPLISIRLSDGTVQPLTIAGWEHT